MTFNKLATVIIIFLSLSVTQAMANTTVSDLLNQYQKQGAKTADAKLGEKFWYTKYGDKSCTDCHGSSPDKMGSHIKTGKAIKPMSSLVNPKRFTKGKKVEKWFLRNCKWTLGRECTAQEKSNTLIWLNSF